MYKNVGKELKIRANGIVYKSMLIYALISGAVTLAGVYLIGNGEYYWALVAVCIGAIIGEVIGRNKAIELYAFGELVECVAEIKKKLCEDEVPTETTVE